MKKMVAAYSLTERWQTLRLLIWWEKVKAKVHPFVEYFKFLKQFEDEQTVAKYTIPAPAQMYQQMIVPQNIEQTRKILCDR